MDITELQQVQPYTLLRFAKASKRFIWPFGHLGAAHWAKTDYGLSAGQHAVLPEGKGKGIHNEQRYLPSTVPWTFSILGFIGDGSSSSLDVRWIVGRVSANSYKASDCKIKDCTSAIRCKESFIHVQQWLKKNFITLMPTDWLQLPFCMEANQKNALTVQETPFPPLLPPTNLEYQLKHNK